VHVHVLDMSLDLRLARRVLQIAQGSGVFISGHSAVKNSSLHPASSGLALRLCRGIRFPRMHTKPATGFGESWRIESHAASRRPSPLKYTPKN
jgi:hypothetical protein